MATYTSTQNGNWNTDATWGGGGHPSLDNDVVNIGHEVTYDAGDLDIDFGNITITNGGVLIFPTASDSTLKFNATGILIVQSGGELRIGTSDTPISAANHAYIHWPQGAGIRDVIQTADGAIVNIYGDPDFYGSERYATLNGAWTASAGDLDFVTNEDRSGDWAAGQKIVIHKHAGSYGSHLTDGEVFTIDSVVGNTITVTSEGGENTFADGATVIMLSRNVELIDPGSPETFGGHNTYNEYIKWDNNQGVIGHSTYIENAYFRGFYNVQEQGWQAIFKECLILNCYRPFNGCMRGYFDIDVVSADRVFSGFSNNFLTGKVIGADYVVDSGNGRVFDFEGLAVNTPHNSPQGIIFDGCVYTDSAFPIHRGFNNLVRNCIYDGVTLLYSTDRINISNVYENCNWEGTIREYRFITGVGTGLPLINGEGGWQAPPSGHTWETKMVPLTNCNTEKNLRLAFSPLKNLFAYISAGLNTITFKIYPVGWTSSLDQDDIYLEAFYLDEASGIHRAKAVTGAGTFANDGWRDLMVTFTAGQDGVVYFNLFMTKYESACYVLIDPVWSLS